MKRNRKKSDPTKADYILVAVMFGAFFIGYFALGLLIVDKL